jgi:hypothetical protein
VNSKLLAGFVKATASVEGVNVAGSLVLIQRLAGEIVFAECILDHFPNCTLRRFCICPNLKLSGCAS